METDSLRTVASFLGISSGTDPNAEAIRAEQLKVVYGYLPTLLAINAFVAAAMVFALWRVTSGAALVAWLAAMSLVIAIRAASCAGYRRAPRASADALWGRVFTFGAGAQGLAWGMAGIMLMPPDSLEYQLFVLFVLVGMAAGAISSLAAYTPALYAFLPAAVLPVSAYLFFGLGEPIHVALGLMTLLYVGALVYFGGTIHQRLEESLSLRFANVELVRQLSRQRDEAERANVGKSKFLAAASHDLRQPLYTLMLFMSALDERIENAEERRIFEHIKGSVASLEKLFDALLDVSRLDAGVLQPEMRHFELDDLLSRLVSEHAPAALAKNLKLVYTPVDLVVRSDPALLDRILRNYISNAVRYTEDGEVRISVLPGDGRVRIEVRDTGIGIPASQHAAVFDEFYQLGNPERDRTKGLGLGLAIVQRVAKLLDHPIDMTSQPGRGSCFSVTVPLGDRALLAAPTALREPDAADLEDLCVLVVDDEMDVREGMSTLLMGWGCRPIAAGSEDEAMAMLRARRALPDAVIVDYRLRDGRTGVQVIERLGEELDVHVPALIVTGDTGPERLREARASRHPLAHKPVEAAVLKDFLRGARRRSLDPYRHVTRTRDAQTS